MLGAPTPEILTQVVQHRTQHPNGDGDGIELYGNDGKDTYSGDHFVVYTHTEL